MADLTIRQRSIMSALVPRLRAGEPLRVVCKGSGIRYETALRALGLPTGGATVTTADLAAAASSWSSDQDPPRAAARESAALDALYDLAATARLVAAKFGIDDHDNPSDWTEWVNLRDAVEAADEILNNA